MITKLLAAAARVALTKPKWVIAASVLPLALSLYAFRVPVDLSFAGLMNRDHPEVARYFAASERYGLGGLLPLLIEGPEESLDESVLAVQLALDDVEAVRSIVAPPPREWFLARAPWIVERPTFEAWMQLAREPEASGVVERLRADLELLERRHLPPAPRGARLLVVTMADDPFELALDADHFPRIRDATRQALAPFGARARFAGMPAIVTQEQEATLARMRVLGPASFVLVLAIFAWVERRPAMIASVATPMLASVGCTFGLIGWWAGRLTIMESVFGVIVFGLGIDFAIHLLLRLREELDKGRDFAPSLDRAIAGTGTGIVAGAVTTSAAFLVLALAPEPVFYRLGVAGGLGLLLCLVFMLTLLPAQWVLIERRARGSSRPGSSFRVPGLARLTRLATRFPLATLGVGALVVAWGGFGLRHLHYETNLERVFSRDIEAVDTAKRIHELFHIDPGPWLVATKDLEEARRVTRAFDASPVFARTESVAFLFPDDRADRERQLDAIAPSLARDVRVREGRARALPPEEAAREREKLDALTALLRAQAFGPPELDALPESLSQRLVAANGDLLVYAFAAEPALDSAVAARERRAAQAIHPKATSMSVLYEVLIGTDRPWMPRVVAAALLSIALVLYADLRSLRLTLLTLLPIATSAVVTVGLLSFFGFSFNTVTLVAVPLLLGVGVDDGIHIVHRMREEPERPLSGIVASVARPIAMTTLTTCASLGVLLLTRHPGIESIAVLLLVGLPLCLLSSATLLPACAIAIGTGLRRPAKSHEVG